MTTPIITRVALCVILFLCCTYIVNLSIKRACKVFNDSVVQNVFNRTVLKPIFDGVLRYVITMVLLLFLYNLSLNPQTSFALLVLLIMLFGLSLILVSPFQK